MLLVVGGQARKVGKTSVVCDIIRATPELRWTAVKIAGHRHDREPDRGDTARYLAAGAVRAMLLDAETAELATLAAEDKVICESTRIAAASTPDCALLVVDPSRQDWKESAREFAVRAHALVVVSEGAPPHWIASKPLFRVAPPRWASSALIEFVLGLVRKGQTSLTRDNERH